MSQINPISETFLGTSNSVYNLLYPGIIQGPFSSNVYVNSVLQTAVSDYNIIANTLIFYTGKPDANIIVQHYTDDNASINLTNLIELTLQTSALPRGTTIYRSGDLLIGNGITGGLDRGNLTAGSGVSILNGNGTITISTISGLTYYLENGALSDVPPYHNLINSPSLLTENTISFGATGTLSYTLLSGFITASGNPNTPLLPAGTYGRHFHVTTGASNQVARLRGELYKYAANGLETLLRTADSPDFSQGSENPLLTWNITDSASYALALTDRLLFKLYAARVSGPATCTISVYTQGVDRASYIVTTILGVAAGPVSSTVDQYARDKANGAAQLGFPKINVASNVTVVSATTNNSTLFLLEGTGITMTSNSSQSSITITATGGSSVDQYARDKANGAVQTGFVTINIANSPNIVATGNANTLTFFAGDGISLIGNSVLNRINVSSTRFRNSDWVNRTPASNIAWEQVIWADKLNLFVAVSSNSSSVPGNLRVMTSPEGITWTSRTAAEQIVYTGIGYNGNVLVAVASSTFANQVMISANAVTWQSLPAAVSGIQWRDVTWNGNIFCAIAATGVANGVMISTDGTTWLTRVPAADLAWRSIVWAPELSLFVAVGTSGVGNRVMTSPDGTTWTSQTSAADLNWIDVTWNGKIFVAVAFSGTNNQVMTSPDGINWTSRYTPTTTLQWTAVQWTGTEFVVVANTGTGNRVMTSPDGITWTVRVSPTDAAWKGLAWNGQVLVAVGTAGNNDQVMTSTYDDILMAGAGITFTANSKANTLSVSVDASNVTVGTLALARGGTGLSLGAITNGQILIGNTVNSGFDLATISNTGAGGIIVSNDKGIINLTANLVWIRGNISATTPIVYTPGTGIITHATSGVGAAIYGGANTVPVVTVDTFGHITLAANSAINNLDASTITTGNLVVARGGTGRSLGAITNGQILIGNTVNSGFDLATISNTGQGGIIVSNDKGIINLTANLVWIRGNISATAPIAYDATTGIITHAVSGVGAAIYGGANTVPVVTVDTFGHITLAANSAVNNLNASTITSGNLVVARGGTGLSLGAITNGQILIGNTVNSGFDLATISNTGAGGIIVSNDKGIINLTANLVWIRGNISATTPIVYTPATGVITHATSGVGAAIYGGANTVPVVTVDTFGHITLAANSAINNLNASTITSGNLVVARGGTGLSLGAVTNGQILIGNTVNGGFDLAFVTNTGIGGIIVSNDKGIINLTANLVWIRGNISATTPIVYTPATGVITHATSGVSATIYGGANTVPVVTIDTFGHITLAANSAVNNLDASTITTGNLVVARGGTGRSLGAITNGQILIGNTVNSGFDLATISNTGTGGIIVSNDKGIINLTANLVWIRGNISATAPVNYTAATGVIAHDASGVTATGYGSGNLIPTYVVSTTGHITSALNVESTMSATIHQQTMTRVSLGF